MPRRALASLLVGVFVSAICLWYAFRGVDLAAMAEGIGRVGLPWVLASVLAAMLSLVIRAVRWRFLLPPETHIRIWSLLSATFIGFMANGLLPARFGEVVRAWALSRHEATSMPTALASIVVERLFDVIAALALLGVALAAAPELGGNAATLLKRSGIVVLAVVAVGVAVLLIVVRYRSQMLPVMERWAVRRARPWAARAVEFVLRFLEGLCTIRSGWQGTVVFALSLVVWMTAIAAFQVLSDGFELGLTPVQTTLVFVIVLFGVAIPSAPGFVGTFHGFCVAGLSLVAGIEPTIAAAYATLLHGSQWLTTIVVGLGCLLMDRSLTWSGMMGLAREN